jgi:hypothetical protein
LYEVICCLVEVKLHYTKTCLLQPFKGCASIIMYGLCRQVVLVWSSFITTEVSNEPAYCGLYRQVVYICKWSIRQTHCIIIGPRNHANASGIPLMWAIYAYETTRKGIDCPRSYILWCPYFRG